MADSRTFTVNEDDDGIRLDRWFKRNHARRQLQPVSRWARTGQLRVDGKRVAPGDRIAAGQVIRVPPAEAEPQQAGRPRKPDRDPLTDEEAEFVRVAGHPEDEHGIVLNKPPGPRHPGRDQDRPIISTGCSTAWRVKRAPGPSSSTGSTRTRRACLLVARTARAAASSPRLLGAHRAQGLLGADRRRAVARGRA